MKQPHLARVTEPPEAFAPLIAAARAAGLRVGWLDLEASPPALPAHLAAAAEAGALRAVSVAAEAAGGARILALKPLAGPPVLRDLLREHFLGCRLVLVAGAAGEGLLPPDLPQLESQGDGWHLTAGDCISRLSAEGLVERLRKVRL